MKKLLILSALAVLTVGTVGCCQHRVKNWWHRGAICTPPVISNAIPGCVEDCTTCCESCNDTGSYLDGYTEGTDCSSCDLGISASTHDSGPGFIGSGSSRPAVAPEPGNDT